MSRAFQHTALYVESSDLMEACLRFYASEMERSCALLRAHYAQHAAFDPDGEVSVEGCIKLALHLGFPGGEEGLIAQLNEALNDDPRALSTADGFAQVAVSLGLNTLRSTELSISKRELAEPAPARDETKARAGREKRKGNTPGV